MHHLWHVTLLQTGSHQALAKALRLTLKISSCSKGSKPWVTWSWVGICQDLFGCLLSIHRLDPFQEVLNACGVTSHPHYGNLHQTMHWTVCWRWPISSCLWHWSWLCKHMYSQQCTVQWKGCTSHYCPLVHRWSLCHTTTASLICTPLIDIPITSHHIPS